MWTRTRQWCSNLRPACNFDTVRRTVWDGTQLLYEIQMADSTDAENDGQPGQQPRSSDFDPNPLLGRVLFTHGPGIDQPLSMIRMGLGDHPAGGGYWPWPGFTVIPLWGTAGNAPYVTFGDGTRLFCPPWIGRCLGTNWRLAWDAYGARKNGAIITSGGAEVWLGSLMLDQQDASGLLYRRNRYYDPQTGRFTQEDPIGLAGGLNAYGFAEGDPVSNADPFGLVVCSKSRLLRRGIEKAVNASINWDQDGCVSSLSQITFHGGDNPWWLGGNQWEPIQSIFSDMVRSTDVYTVVRGDPSNCWIAGCSGHNPSTRTYTIFDIDWDRIDGATGKFHTGYAYPACRRTPNSRRSIGTMALGALIIHELIWHGQGPLYGTFTADDRPIAFNLENIYNRAHGRPERCGS